MMIPSRISRFDVDREIGRGAPGIVYLAFDSKSGEPVAIKELVISHTVNGQDRTNLIERFKREAKTISRISDPGIPKILEVGELGDIHYMVLEFCPGQTLRSVLDQRKQFSEPEALKITEQILRTLQSAHAHGVFHRDIKPDNIMLSPSGSIKLMDFGIAKVLGDATLTGTGAIFGTPAYM
jgi:serine/threonine protein kinase